MVFHWMAVAREGSGLFHIFGLVQTLVQTLVQEYTNPRPGWYFGKIVVIHHLYNPAHLII